MTAFHLPISSAERGKLDLPGLIRLLANRFPHHSWKKLIKRRAQPAENGTSELVSNVGADCTEIARMNSHSFVLQRNGPFNGKSFGRHKTAQTFPRLCKSRCMSDCRVPCDIFSQRDPLEKALLVREKLFYSPVLVSQLDLEMEDLLSVADKPEMARLDDTRMNGTDADLVKFFPFKFVKWIVGDRLQRGCSGRVDTGPVSARGDLCK